MANSPKKIDAFAATSVGISYVGGGAPVLLEPNAVVTANGNFAGETLTISGLLTNDQIGFSGLTITGNTIQIANKKVATFSGGANGQDLVITFGRGVVAHDVECLLHNLTYSNAGQNPVSHTLSISFAGTAHTDLVTIGATTSGTANTAPIVDLDASASGASAALSYMENAAPKAIAPSAIVSDADSADFNGGSLTVAFTANGTSADQLTIGNQGSGAGQIGVSGSNILWGGNVIGTFSGGVNGTALTIAFTSNGATPAAVQALVRDILYSNSSDDPSTAARTVTYTLNDGDGTANGGHNIGSASATIAVTAVDDAPATTPVTLTAIAEDSGARLITQAELLAHASDVDNGSLTATNLAIHTGSGSLVDNGDGTWSYTPASNDDSGVTFTYMVTDGSLTAAGSASLDIMPVNNDGPAIHLTDPISGPLGPTSEFWSSDGTRLILASTATLTADDSDGGAGTDLFAVNLATGTETLITASVTGGVEGDSWVEAMSPDATKLVLGSTSTLTPDDTDAGVAGDFYLYDFATGAKTLLTEPVSGPHGDTHFMGWSSDGSKLLLQSTASLTADDTDGGNGWDVFVVDAATGAKTLLTASLPGGAEGSFSPASWSPHGADLVVQSTATLTPDDTDGGSGGYDLYLVDAATSAKTLLTAPVAGGSEGSSQFGAWSPDGSKIAFTSNSGLTSDALNDNVWDVYVADVATGAKTLLTAPIAGGHDNADFAGWSPDGATLLLSTASSLTAGDTDGENGLDLYAVNLATGEKTLLTQSVPGGVEGDSWLEGWSPDGSKIVIGSQSTLTADDSGGASSGLYAIDLTSGQKTLLTAPVAGGAGGDVRFAGWSPDGTKILIAATSTLTADDTNGPDWDLFSVDLATGTKTLLTAPAAGGVEGDSDFVFDIAHGSAPEPVWSSDGHSVRIVTSTALVNADTDNGGEDLYWVDATTGAKSFTDLGIDQQPGQFAWAETAGPESATLVGIATDVSGYYLLV